MRLLMFTYKVDEEVSLKIKDFQDSSELFNLIDSSRDYLKKWMTWVESTKNEEDVRKRTKNDLYEFAEQKGMHFLILHKGSIVGTISLKYFDWSIKSAEIGYWLAEEFQGQGLMTKAVKALLDYGFDQLHLNKIEIWAAKKNMKSRSVPERLGFVQEGMRRDDEIINGKYVTMIIYGMLKSEWNAR